MAVLQKDMITEIYNKLMPQFIPKIIWSGGVVFVDGLTIEAIELGFDIIFPNTNECMKRSLTDILPYINYKIDGPNKNKIILGINTPYNKTNWINIKRVGEFIELKDGSTLSRQHFRDIIDLLKNNAKNMIEEKLKTGKCNEAAKKYAGQDLIDGEVIFDEHIAELY